MVLSSFSVAFLYVHILKCTYVKPDTISKPKVHDLRHCRFTNAVRSSVYPHIADAIVGHGDKKKSLESLYLTLSYDDLIKAIDMMELDRGETEIRVKR
ncbi:MAG: hypothetical protein AB1733_19255 [Thermodesulfobacteriota bacterium]